MLRRLPGQIATTVFAVALSLAFLILTGRATIPPRFNPFAPFDPAEAPGLFTALKFARVRTDPALCRAALTRAGVRFEPVADQVTGEGCGYRNAVRVARLGAPLASPVTATCPLVLGLAMLERHTLSPEAQRRFGVGVARIEHFGSYSCRNINHRAFGRRSQHATANAFDLAAIVLTSGQRISLLADWSGENAARRAYLRAAREGACRWFDVTLSPDYNALHRDHFHFDMGGRRACR